MVREVKCVGLRRVLVRDYEMKQEIYKEFWKGDGSEMFFFLKNQHRDKMITLR
jgi:hypothetical protein